MTQEDSFNIKKILACPQAGFGEKILPKTYRVEKNVEISFKKWQELSHKYDMELIFDSRPKDKIVISTDFLLDLVSNPPKAKKQYKYDLIFPVMFLTGLLAGIVIKLLV